VTDVSRMTNWNSQVVRFGLVGLAVNALAYGCYILVTGLVAADPRVSIAIVQLAFLPISFLAQQLLTFSGVRAGFSGFLVYGLGYLGSVAFQALNLHVLHSVLLFPHQIVAAVGMILAAYFFFLLQRIVIFVRP